MTRDHLTELNDDDQRIGRTKEWYRRRDVWFALALLLLTVGQLSEARLWLPGRQVNVRQNVQVAEAKAWWIGKLDIPERRWDTALLNGRIYSHFPPMFSFVSAAVLPVFGGVPHLFLVVALALPVVLLGFALFLRRVDAPFWAVVLTIALVCGTSAWPVLRNTLRKCNPYHVNQTLAMIGVLVLLIEYFGRRRVWLAGIGLVVAALSRQLTIAYLIPLAYMAWRKEPGRERGKALAAFGVTMFVVVGVPMLMSTLKFGHPLESGYKYLYSDRPEDEFSKDAQVHGIFSPHYLGRNAYYMNLGFPRRYEITMAGKDEVHYRPNRYGTGIWWTTPLLLWLFVDLRRILRDPDLRVLLLPVVMIVVALLFYHSTGWMQRGFNRYSMDYVPVLLALIVPRCIHGWRKWVSLAMIGWGVLYFRWLV